MLGMLLADADLVLSTSYAGDLLVTDLALSGAPGFVSSPGMFFGRLELVSG